MSTATHLMTAEEFLHLRDPIEGGKMELVGGRVITTSPVGLRHGQVAGEVYDEIKARRGFVDGEVLSPEDRATDVAEKLLEYVAAETPRIWVVDPDKETVTVYKPGRTHTLDINGVLTADDAGFEGGEFLLPLTDIFGD